MNKLITPLKTKTTGRIGRKRKPRCTTREKRVLKFPKKYMFWPCTSILASQYPICKGFGPKSRRFLKEPLTHPIAEMCFKEIQSLKRNVCLLLCVQKEAAGSAGLQLTLPSSFMSSKEGANFCYSYKYHCLKEYYTSQKLREII